jgi:hypothetical protein|tara:strand:- start:910 stop:1905 length:996 start_codon:yes stop_codon:yes gene_type:complete
MNITIARLRSNVKYNGPLETVLDSFFENYVKWMRANPQHKYDTYNVSFNQSRPQRTPETIKWADVIVIPSDSEFRYHGELQMNPKDLAKSESHIEKIAPFFEGKTVVMFRSDRGDTEELYRSFLPGIKNFTTIDEVDFSGNIHGMKYHFIQTLKNPLADMIGNEKTIDFAYWGRMKHGHDREKTIRQIYRSELSTVMVGGFPSGVKRQSAWIKDWRELYPMLEPARCTLCFNWISETATTSRCPEALSIGMIPFVWRKYDINNTYRIDDFQRVSSSEEFVEKALQLRNKDFFETKLSEYRSNYKEVLLSQEEYFKLFSEKMQKPLDFVIKT